MNHYIYLNNEVTPNVQRVGNRMNVQIGHFLQDMPARVNIKVISATFSYVDEPFATVTESMVLKIFTPALNAHSVDNKAGSVLALLPLSYTRSADDEVRQTVNYTKSGEGFSCHFNGNFSTISLGFENAAGEDVPFATMGIILEVSPYYQV